MFDADILRKLRSDGTLLTDPDPYEQLWRRYFDNIAIRERNNPRLQQAFMPKKYWRYLTEKRK